MSCLLHRLGRSTAAHPWRTIFAWVLIAVGIYALAGSIGGTPQDNLPTRTCAGYGRAALWSTDFAATAQVG
jgi:uncharacterized membrane protein YdfJ with MMPL/SSD domain